MTTTTTNKRKVLFFIPIFPVLTETFIEREVVELSTRGNLELTVFSLAGERKRLSPEIKDLVHYKRLNVFNLFISFFFIIARLHRVVLASRTLDSAEISWSRKIRLLVKAVGYSFMISRFKPDFLFAHFLSEPSTIIMLVSKILNLPFGISGHARDIKVYAEFVYEKIRESKFILICNKSAYEFLLKMSHGGDTSKIILHYHGVNLDRLHETVVGGIDKPTIPVVLNVGGLREKKGHAYLIGAAKIIKERGFNCMTYIIGAPGPLYQELQGLIKSSGLEDRVIILGEGKGMDFSKVLEYLKIADVFVFPGITASDGDEDGIPNVVVEAAALKVPLVVTDAGSSKDIVENEISGLVVPQKDAHLLADAMERLLFDKKLAQKVSEVAYEKVTKEFNLKTNVEEIERLII